MWFIGLMLMTQYGYISNLIIQPFPTEQACRDAAAKDTGLPEMPPANTDPKTWPARGWNCVKG